VCQVKALFSGDVIEAGTRYTWVYVEGAVEQRRSCYAAVTWRIPETDSRFLVEA
jgi:hypothetical protein